MKRTIACAFLLLGIAGAARAQISVPEPLIDPGNSSPQSFANSSAKLSLLDSLAPSSYSFWPAAKPPEIFADPTIATALSAEPVPADPAPPKPKFIYGGRDDYRWQLALGITWLRFRSNVFNASAVGIQTTVAYFLNNWLGVEGNVTAAFAPTILQNEHVKLATYGGGAKIAWRQKQWEPWLHGIFGGAHEQPEIAGQSRTSYSIEAGGGADYRWRPQVSLRLEGDYVRTAFFKQGQNNFQLTLAGVVHF